MANRLFESGNYIIAQQDGVSGPDTYEFVKSKAYYLERNEFYNIFQVSGTSFSIAKADIGTFLNAETGGAFYTEATLLTFLRTFTGVLPSSNIIVNGLHSDLVLDDGSNPHGTTKSDVGLSNVDNTSDLDKPISNLTQTALNDKLETVSTDATLTGDGTIADPLSAVGGSGLNPLETVTLDGNIITPPTLNSDQDDYNPTGFGTCNLIRQEINGDRVITGFEAPPAGLNRVFAITNLSTSDKIKFKNNDSSSSASNRLLLRDNGPDKSLKKNETAIFYYDHTSLRWRVYNRVG